VNIYATDLSALGQYDITVNWDDSILQYNSITNGGLLGSTGRTVICQPPDVTSNSVTLSCLTLGILPGVDGDGVLATLSFTGIAEGKSLVTLDPVSLQTILGVPLDVHTTHGDVDIDDGSNVGMWTCSSNSPVTTSSGDNNGFESNAAAACADDSVFARDLNTGTNNTTTCSDAGKDRHIFEDFDIDVSGGDTIDGIEVRLDVKGDTAAYVCAELSWDGGSSWTPAKFTFGLGSTETTRWLGSPTDTWGHTWNGGGDWSNGNFRVRLTSVANVPNATVDLDYVEVHFYSTN
jgi:hypothetical protein